MRAPFCGVNATVTASAKNYEQNNKQANCRAMQHYFKGVEFGAEFSPGKRHDGKTCNGAEHP
jgi:hypothetical protein